MNHRKVILSRKGFDSSAGGKPSPIIGGRMLSLPIPMWSDVKYSDLCFQYEGSPYNYEQLMRDLGTAPYSHCHLDPDIRADVMNRHTLWVAGIGQAGPATAELKEVNTGDLFLFFGWFRKAELVDGRFSYVKNSPDFHAIWGYMEVKTKFDLGSGVWKHGTPGVPASLHHHPHFTDFKFRDKANILYEAQEKLSYLPGRPGHGTFEYREDLILTHDFKNNRRKSLWNPITCLKPPTRIRKTSEGHWDSGGRGQEFLMTLTDQNTKAFNKWLGGLFGTNHPLTP